MKIYKSNGSVAKSFNPGTQDLQQDLQQVLHLQPRRPATYKVKTFATDAAGNAQSSQDNDSLHRSRSELSSRALTAAA